MASPRQIDANRRNAQKSTGPTTEEGKAASRRNALTHGLTASEVLTDEDREAVEARSAEWRLNYRLGTTDLDWHFEQMVAESVLLDRCRAHLEVNRREEMLNARANWDVERRREAEDLGATLAEQPGPVSLRLQETRHGVEWMIGSWKDLGTLFERQGYWTKGQVSLALDLMGIPGVLREAKPAIDDPAGLVGKQVARLEKRLTEGLEALDDFRRRAAESGLPTSTPSRALSTLRRYESACLRRFRAAEKKLEPFRQAPAAPAPPAPAPAAPVPECKNEPDGAPGKMENSQGSTGDAAARPTPASVPAPAPAAPATVSQPTIVPTMVRMEGGRPIS